MLRVAVLLAEVPRPAEIVDPVKDLQLGNQFDRTVEDGCPCEREDQTLGGAISETLIGRENWLPAFDRMMIEAGEAGGRLDDTLRILSDHYHQRSALIRDVLMKLAYPLFIIHFIILMPGIILYGRSLLGGGWCGGG